MKPTDRERARRIERARFEHRDGEGHILRTFFTAACSDHDALDRIVAAFAELTGSAAVTTPGLAAEAPMPRASATRTAVLRTLMLFPYWLMSKTNERRSFGVPSGAGRSRSGGASFAG